GMAVVGILERWRGRRARRATAHRIYVALVEQARQPAFYDTLGVPDTLDGRFDMIVLHLFLVLRRLRAAGGEGTALGQAVFDVMFADMDQSLRELGVGDLGVGRRITAMTKAFMGRVDAYAQACASGPDALAAAIARNVYREPGRDASALARYAAASAAVLAALADDAVLAGQVGFAEVAP
ncbi:MAG: ubiquinol-cytochrome C chaperone family protein, partial [Alphaproteobacteria bacterium]